MMEPLIPQVERAAKVTIIIPHYNQRECIERLLPSIAHQTFRDFEAIVIDDCTPDRSAVEYIKGFAQDHPNIRLVENTENLRFIKTVNKGIKLAAGEYICLLNSDTEVANNFVERNVEIMDADSSVAGLSCVIVDENGRNWFTGGRYRHGVSVNLVDDFQGLRPVDFIAGTAAFYRRDVFAKLGLFDERYIMYHEDVEFGLRIRAKTAYRVCMFSDKLVTHHLVPSIPRSESYYYIGRNLSLMLKEYSRNRAYYIYIVNILLLHIPRIIVASAIVSIPSRRLQSFFLSFRSLHMIRGAFDGLVKG